MEEGSRSKPSNADQLRAAIDSGVSADKVAFPDPAAAPLGTDAEAGGVASTAGEVSQALSAQNKAAPAQKPHRGRALPLALGFIGMIAISTVITLLIFAL